MTTKRAGIDWETVAKLFAGGALTGAGLGAGVSYWRHLKALEEEAKRESDTSYDDDVLYLNLPNPAQPQLGMNKLSADANSATTFALGGLGAATGMYLSYNLIRNIYQKARKKQLQRKLDEQQQVYISGLQQGQSLKKSAGQFNLISKGVGSAYLAALLTALGSAIVTNKILQKQFPPIKSPLRDKPRKIVVRRVNSEQQPVETENVVTPGEVTPDAAEGVLRTHLGNKSAAAKSGFADLVAAAAQGRCKEIHAALSIGLDTMFDTVKGARFEKCSSLKRELATTWVVTDSFVGSATAPLLAAEFYDMSPGLCKLASFIEDRFVPHLVGLSESAVQEVRKTVFSGVTGQLKKASMIPLEEEANMVSKVLVAGALRGMLDDSDAQDEVNPKSVTSNPAVQSSPVDPKRPAIEATDDEALAFVQQYGKTIDNVVSQV